MGENSEVRAGLCKVEDVMVKWMGLTGGARLLGQAPRGALGRKAQEIIDELTNKNPNHNIAAASNA